MLWGLGRTLQHEQPTLKTTLVDLDRQATAEAMAATLFAEICHSNRENQVALRNGDRWAPRLCRGSVLPSEEPGPAERNGQHGVAPWVHSDSTYLVACDTETVGLRLAEWLGNAGATRLVVVWPQEPSPTARQAIAELCDAGVQVHARTADVAEMSELAEVMTEVLAGGHALGGVIFAAGDREPGGNCLGCYLDPGSPRRLEPSSGGARVLGPVVHAFLPGIGRARAGVAMRARPPPGRCSRQLPANSSRWEGMP